MDNIRIVSQGRACYVNGKRIEYFNVVADSKRFGLNEIMAQGSFRDCIHYLRENVPGFDYFEYVWQLNHNRDIQISMRKYKILNRDGNIVTLKDRQGFEWTIDVTGIKTVDNYIFKIKNAPHGDKTATIKFLSAIVW